MATTKKTAGKSIEKAVNKKKSKFPARAHNSFPYCIEIEHSASNPLLPHTPYPTLSPTGNRFPKSVYFMYETTGRTGTVTLPGGYFKNHPKEFPLIVHKDTGRTKTVTLNPKGVGVLSGKPIMWQHVSHSEFGGGVVVDPPGGGGIVIG
jgi:hypothetical protein